MADWDVMLEWVSDAGVKWRVCRAYVKTRQQFEVRIESKARAQWFVREQMAVNDSPFSRGATA